MIQRNLSRRKCKNGQQTETPASEAIATLPTKQSKIDAAPSTASACNSKVHHLRSGHYYILKRKKRARQRGWNTVNEESEKTETGATMPKVSQEKEEEDLKMRLRLLVTSMRAEAPHLEWMIVSQVRPGLERQIPWNIKPVCPGNLRWSMNDNKLNSYSIRLHFTDWHAIIQIFQVDSNVHFK